MTQDQDIAKAVAFFQQADDRALLQDVLRGLRPKAAAAVRRYQERGREVPPPLEITPAEIAATKEEALQTVKADLDFGQLQAISRAAGRRLESLTQDEA